MQGSTRIDELRQKFHENPRRYFAPLANEYRKAGDPEQAIAICRAHLAQQPGHMSGHVVYGQALFDANRKEEARGVFEKALALDPDNAIVLKHLGAIAREKGDTSEAKHWYSRAIDLDPSDREVAAYIAELTEPVTEEVAQPAEAAVTAPAEPEREAEPEIEREAPVAVEREPEVAAEQAAESSLPPVEAAQEPSPAEDDVVWRKTPPHEESPFVTRTMAELYASQGYREAALDVYRQLALHHPDDKEIFDRIEALQKIEPPATQEPPAPAEPEQPAIELQDRAAETPAIELESSIETGAIELQAPMETAAAESQAPETEAPAPAASNPMDLIPFEPLISDLPVEEGEMEIDEVAAFPPTDEDLNLEPGSQVTPHFTELELGTSGDAWDRDSWGAGFDADEDVNLDFDSPDVPSHEPQPEPVEPLREEAAEPAQAEASQESPPVEAIEEVQESPPVQALAEVQESPPAQPIEVQESGQAEAAEEAPETPPIQAVEEVPEIPSVQPAEEEEPATAITEPVVEIVPPSVEVAPEPAAEFPPEPAPEEEGESGEPAEYEPEPEEASFVAYSPQLPEKEDLPHYAPKHPTVREFFATIGAFHPAKAGSAITAHAAMPDASHASAPDSESTQNGDDYPLATDAFTNLFGDAPVSEDDTRAAFALSGAIGASTPPSNVAVSAPTEPQPAPEAAASEQPAQESEEDIRRFREWLDGLAES